MPRSSTAFAMRLKKLRAARGLSQEALAERAGLSKNAISSFERGERFPRARTLDGLARGLSVEPSALVGDLLTARERPPDDSARRGAAVGELVALLDGEPERSVRLVADLARLVLPELRREAGEAPAQRKRR